MSSSRVVCSVGRTTSWLMRLVSSPARSFRKSGALTPAAQTINSAGSSRPSASRTPSGTTSATLASVCTSTPSLRNSSSDASDRRARQGRQHARRGLDEQHADVLVGIDAVQPEGHHFARRAVQFGGQLDAGGAGTDDGHMQLLRPHRRVLGMGADAGVDHARMKAQRVGGRLQPHRVFAHTRGAEIVALAADRDHQRVVAEGALRRDLPAFVIDMGRHQYLAPRAVQAHHFADAVAEVVPVRLREVAHLVGAHVHAAGRDLVQLGLPDVGALALDQRDLGLLAATQTYRPAAWPVRARPPRRRR